MKFIGHLDVMRFFQKVMRRADVPIAFTGGFSPHMIMSFANPLGVGVTSDGEYFDIELTQEIDMNAAVERMNQVMVEGMEVVNMVSISDDKKQTAVFIKVKEVHFSGSQKRNQPLESLPPLPKIEKFTEEELAEFNAVFEGGDYPF